MKAPFLLYLMVEIVQLVHEAAVSQKCSIKEAFWKTQNLQPQEMFLKLHSKFYRTKPVLESLFNKDVVLGICNFIKENSERGAFLLNWQTF